MTEQPSELLNRRAARVMERADALARFTEEPGRITRPYGSRALVGACDTVASWLEEARLAVRRDAVGNVVGRAGGVGEAFALGSHVDSVRDAGRYDGPLGVLVAIEAAEALAEELPFPLEVVAFADEEGLRFGSAVPYLGARAYCGDLRAEELGCMDADGITLSEAARAAGGDPALLAKRPAGGLRGYLEVHIEQGPVLEAEGLPVGIVASIAGQSRGSARFAGRAGHAGTTPMPDRRDALAGAAAFVLEVERMARARDGLVATVGSIVNEPNVGNVVPGRTAVTFDVRHPDDAERRAASRDLGAAAGAIAAERGLALDWELRMDDPSVVMSVELRALLAGAFEQAGVRPLELVSGAGHDAVPISRLTPDVAMLFVRCKKGVSHHPDESVELEDVATALDVVLRFLHLLAP